MSGEHSKSKKFLEYISGLPSFSFSLVVLSLVPGWNSLDDHLKRRFDSIQLFLFLLFLVTKQLYRNLDGGNNLRIIKHYSFTQYSLLLYKVQEVQKMSS